MTITTDAASPNLEPCLIYNSCDFCENNNCNPHVQNYLKNGTRLQGINRYSAHLEYECGLAKEFVSSGVSTSQSISMTCDWSPQWTPTSTIPECKCKSTTRSDKWIFSAGGWKSSYLLPEPVFLLKKSVCLSVVHNTSRYALKMQLTIFTLQCRGCMY